ncbi:hypothetical protein H310_14685, partial [Aphanomyces invadans]
MARIMEWVPLALASAGVVLHTAPLCYGDWEFIYSFDDGANFVENPMIQALTVSNLCSMAMSVKINVYEPLSWLLKALVHELVGMQSRYVRMMSVVLHWTACGVLGWTSNRLLSSFATMPPSSDDPAYSFSGQLSAVLFAVHPLHVEILMWPSAQPYPLAMLFTSLMLYLHLEFKPWSAVGAVFYTCAVLSKSIALVTPVGLVLLDATQGTVLPYHDLSQHFRYFRQMRVYIALFLALAATTYVANQGGAGDDVDTISLTLSQRIAKLFLVIVWPIQAWVWPLGLRPHYQISDDLSIGSSPSVLLAALLVVVTFVVGIGSGLTAKSRPHLAILAVAVYIVVMVLPVSGLIQHGMVSLTADRYAYFASVVFVPIQTAVLHRMSRRSATLVALALFGLWSSITSLQTQAWRTEEGLWRYSLMQDPSDWRTLDQLAEYYLHYGRNAEALPLIERSLWFGPTRGFKARLFQAKQRMFLNRVDEGCSMYAALFEDKPHHPAVLNNMAVCALYRGNASAATSLWESAVENERRAQRDKHATIESIPAHNLAQVPAFLSGARGFKAQLMW